MASRLRCRVVVPVEVDLRLHEAQVGGYRYVVRGDDGKVIGFRVRDVGGDTKNQSVAVDLGYLYVDQFRRTCGGRLMQGSREFMEVSHKNSSALASPFRACAEGGALDSGRPE